MTSFHQNTYRSVLSLVLFSFIGPLISPLCFVNTLNLLAIVKRRLLDIATAKRIPQVHKNTNHCRQNISVGLESSVFIYDIIYFVVLCPGKNIFLEYRTIRGFTLLLGILDQNSANKGDNQCISFKYLINVCSPCSILILFVFPVSTFLTLFELRVFIFLSRYFLLLKFQYVFLFFRAIILFRLFEIVFILFSFSRFISVN